MRSLQNALNSWQEIKQYQSLAELREAVCLNGHHTSSASSGLRSACWKAVLLFDSVNTEKWPRIISSSRSAYNSLRGHFLRHFDNPDEIADGSDPLSEGQESSSWNELRKDEELRAEIMQDIDRCMPEITYFRQPDTQRVMLDIIFIFCKLNQDVGYRQGMHELLAPILWTVEHDAVDLGQSSKIMGEDAVVRALFDAEHIEHDTFALFSQVMHSAKNFYEQTTHSATDNPIVVRSKRIFNDLLPQVDPDLSKHLEDIDIVPQVFLMRWIRLLFGREFSFDEMLTIWDVLFLEDPSLQLVDYICVAMLLRIRWELIDADYNAALTLLLRYPAPEKEHPPQTFVMDAIYLRDHMHVDGGKFIVLKYTGRPLQPQDRPITPPALQRNITTFSGLTAAKAASILPTARSYGRPNNLESLFQSTAKNIYARGEKLGIGKAVRTAVDEVHRKAIEIREAQTPSASPNWRSRVERNDPSVTSKIAALEARNKQLSELLQGAVGELWDYQKFATESTKDTEKGSEEVEKLSVAIAKVQFVQVYLDDHSLPLPDLAPEASSNPSGLDEKDALRNSQESPISTKQPSPTKGITTEASRAETLWEYPETSVDKAPEALADPSTFENDSPSPSASPTPKTIALRPKDLPQSTQPPSEHHPEQKKSQPRPVPSPPPAQPPRPPLDQSSFSWMLGESASTAPASFNQASRFSAPPRSDGLLFGDTNARTSDAVVAKKRTAKTRQQRAGGTTAATVLDTDEDVFDLGSLRRAKKT